jgi:uncharacterized protein (TIGR02145 family)
MSTAGRFKTLSAAVAVMVLAIGAFAQTWKKQVMKDKFGDESGQIYMQSVTAELIKNNHPTVRSNKWELVVVDLGATVLTISVSPSPAFIGLVESRPVRISLKDANGKVQTFDGFTNPSMSDASIVTVVCNDINFAKAFDVNTQYTIVLEGVYPGDNWSVRANIAGNSPATSMRATWINDKAKEESIKEEKRKAEEAERAEKLEQERVAKEEAERAKEEAERAKREEAKRSITTFVDSRDKQVYKKVKIGGIWWMAENLNYGIPKTIQETIHDTIYTNSKKNKIKEIKKKVVEKTVNANVCYGNDPANCKKYGGLYDWDMAMKACPVGFRLPSAAEWKMLKDYVDDEKGTKLKSTRGWKKGDNGTDDYGFSGLPGGGSIVADPYDEVGFGGAGNCGRWWSTAAGNVFTLGTGPCTASPRTGREVISKWSMFSVRCVAD